MIDNAYIDSAAATDRLLSALGEQLSLAGHDYDLIVTGGLALLALGLVSRATEDFDVRAHRQRGSPRGVALATAAHRCQRSRGS